jgi:hypothetical protein
MATSGIFDPPPTVKLKATPEQAVKARMLACGWGPSLLADRLNLARDYMHKLTVGKSRAPHWQRKIAAYLGVKPAWLWGEFCHESLVERKR